MAAVSHGELSSRNPRNVPTLDAMSFKFRTVTTVLDSDHYKLELFGFNEHGQYRTATFCCARKK